MVAERLAERPGWERIVDRWRENYTGRTDAVKGKDLAHRLGLKSDAEIRALVNELVRLRFPTIEEADGRVR